MLLFSLGKVCGPLWSTWGASVGEGKSGVKVGILKTKVACQVRTGQTFPNDLINMILYPTLVVTYGYVVHVMICVCTGSSATLQAVNLVTSASCLRPMAHQEFLSGGEQLHLILYIQCCILQFIDMCDLYLASIFYGP